MQLPTVTQPPSIWEAHRASARKKQKLDIATEVGSIRLEHAPPCVVACIDKDRPFKNTSRFQLASVIASVLPTASATDQKNLMDTLEAVVCHQKIQTSIGGKNLCRHWRAKKVWRC